jgi:type I restriction enzyme M protein
MHFLYHLTERGTAGFVMATGELTNSETARLEVRKHLVELGYVDCIVQLTGQLFANTQIPCSLWFLSKNRDGSGGMRERKDEILFIDGRSLGTLIPGSRKQKALSEEELERIAAVYREYRWTGVPAEQPGFAAVAPIDQVREYNYALSPGRYVGSEEPDEESEPFEELFPELTARLKEQMAEARRLQDAIERNLDAISKS